MQEYHRKNPTKIIERTEGFRFRKSVEKPIDFSNFYDETYQFNPQLSSQKR